MNPSIGYKLFTRIFKPAGILLSLVSLVYSKRDICPDGAPLCLSVDRFDNGNLLKISVQGPADAGYLAIGFGNGMSNAEMFIGWFDSNKSPMLTYRQSTGHILPKLMEVSDGTNSNLSIVKAESEISTSGQRITFLRPIEQFGNARALLTSSSSTNMIPMIWAYSSLKPKDENDLAVHHLRGTFNYRMSSTTYSPSISSNLNRISDRLDTNINTSSSSSSLSDSSGDLVETSIIWHGVLMINSWFVITPLAIMTARFLKERMGVWWFRIHTGLFMLSVVINFGAVWVIFQAVGNSFNNPHSIVGLVILILFTLQIILGFVIDRTYVPDRKLVPIRDKCHWWLGRSTFLLASINILYGMALVNHPIYLWLPVIFILVSLLFLFIFNQIRFNRRMSRASKMSL